MDFNLILSTMTKPNSCFEKIDANFSPFYKQAMVIFWIAGVIVIFPSLIEMNQWQEDDSSSDENLLAIKSISIIIEISTAVIQNFIIIYAVFWVGKKRNGQYTTYNKAFTLLSFCLIPSIIGTIGGGIVTTALTSDIQYTQEEGRVINGPLGLEQSSASSNSYNFFSTGIIPNIFAIVFGGWTVILLVKAARILNGFSLKESIITVALAIGIFFFLHVVFGLILGVVMGVSIALSRFS